MDTVVERFLIPKFNELGMNATGQWLDSLETEAREPNIGVIRGQDYSEFLARGRGPNQNQEPDALRKWAYGMANFNPEFKGWLNARGLTDFGVQIAYRLGENGSLSYPEGTDLLEVLESPEVVSFVQNEYRNLVALAVKNEFERNVKEIFV
jgi:hypothetical protein